MSKFHQRPFFGTAKILGAQSTFTATPILLSQIAKVPAFRFLPQVVELHYLGNGSAGKAMFADVVKVLAMGSEAAFEGVAFGFRPPTHLNNG